VRSLLVVLEEPGVKVGLQLVDRLVDLLAEGDPVEFVEDGAMEALANTIGLRAFGLGCGCGLCPGPPDRARTRGSGCRKIRCRDRSARATGGFRARHRTAPRGH